MVTKSSYYIFVQLLNEINPKNIFENVKIVDLQSLNLKTLQAMYNSMSKIISQGHLDTPAIFGSYKKCFNFNFNLFAWATLQEMFLGTHWVGYKLKTVQYYK